MNAAGPTPPTAKEPPIAGTQSGPPKIVWPKRTILESLWPDPFVPVERHSIEVWRDSLGKKTDYGLQKSAPREMDPRIQYLWWKDRILSKCKLRIGQSLLAMLTVTTWIGQPWVAFPSGRQTLKQNEQCKLISGSNLADSSRSIGQYERLNDCFPYYVLMFDADLNIESSGIGRKVYCTYN